MTNEQLAGLRDPEHRQAVWWAVLCPEGHTTNRESTRIYPNFCGKCGCNYRDDECASNGRFTGPDWHADDLACFRDWRPVLLAAGCRIECILDRTNMPRTCVVFGLSILDAGPTYRTPVLAAVAWLAEHKPELLREAIARVEEGK